MFFASSFEQLSAEQRDFSSLIILLKLPSTDLNATLEKFGRVKFYGILAVNFPTL